MKSSSTRRYQRACPPCRPIRSPTHSRARPSTPPGTIPTAEAASLGISRIERRFIRGLPACERGGCSIRDSHLDFFMLRNFVLLFVAFVASSVQGADAYKAESFKAAPPSGLAPAIGKELGENAVRILSADG